MKNKLLTSALVLILFASVFLVTVPIIPTSASPGPTETREVSQAIQLTTDAHYDRDSSFFEAQDGTYWLFFARGRGDPTASGYNPDSDFYDIYYLNSTDQGATWAEYSMPSSVNNPYGQREMAAFQAGDGTIWVFFTDAFYGDPYGTPTYGAYYTNTTDGGVSWSSVQQISGITAYHIDALEALGKIWVFYEGPGSLIYCTNSSDGVTWSTPVQISETGKHGGIPKAMVDTSGYLNVVWCGWTEGGIYRSTSSDGVTWSTPQLILTSTYIACDPVLVQDTSGTYWLFWAPWDSATDSQWLEVVSSTDGSTWSSSIHVTSGGYGTNYWWDMWPEAYQKHGGNMLLFYTSEVASGSYVKGDGNIWMFEVVWTLTNNHYEFIQNAINAANPDDTILVHGGTYVENVNVDKSVTLKAASRPVIDGNQAGPCITIAADGVTVDGFELINGTYGVASWGTDNSVISNNVIHDNLNVPGYAGIGIMFWSDSDDFDNNTISGNEIYNNDRQGIYVGGTTSGYISENNTISGNTIYNNGLNTTGMGPDASMYGIQLSFADNNTIVGNEIYGHDDWFPYPSVPTFDFAQGIYLFDSNDNHVKRNNLHDNNYGVGLYHYYRTVGTNYIHCNNIAGNTGYGVRTFDGPPNVDARYNWWGNETGPYHPTTNPSGTGDRVSDNVDYDPWVDWKIADLNDDWIVDIFDVILAALAFGSRPGDPNWDPRADLNGDNLVDIFDMVMIGINYGKKCC